MKSGALWTTLKPRELISQPLSACLHGASDVADYVDHGLSSDDTATEGRIYADAQFDELSMQIPQHLKSFKVSTEVRLNCCVAQEFNHLAPNALPGGQVQLDVERNLSSHEGFVVFRDGNGIVLKRLVQHPDRDPQTRCALSGGGLCLTRCSRALD